MPLSIVGLGVLITPLVKASTVEVLTTATFVVSTFSETVFVWVLFIVSLENIIGFSNHFKTIYTECFKSISVKTVHNSK